MAMIVERSMSDGWLTNTYLVAAGPNRDAFLVDAGGPTGAAVREGRRARPQRHPRPAHPPPRRPRRPTLGDTLERCPTRRCSRTPPSAFPAPPATCNPGDEVTIGGLTVKALHTPGHTAGMLNLLVDDKELFTGDTLFKGSVGGVRAPGSHDRSRTSSTRSWRSSSRSPARPSCAPATPTRARSPTSSSTTRSCASGAASTPRAPSRCTALGEPATLVLWGPDYDGGHKAWVRWPDGARRHRPGSQSGALTSKG